ncbi:MAG: BC1881 family protein [Clostridia bacterium]|nr:BC1881 family protein [Clostridia bacterium]
MRTVEELREFSTAQLVEELKTREGVTEKIAEPYETLKVEVEGSAIVLIVID